MPRTYLDRLVKHADDVLGRDLPAFRTIAEHTLVVAAGLGFRRYVGDALMRIGIAERYHAHYTTADFLFRQAIEEYSASEHETGIAWGYNQLGRSLHEQLRTAEAREHYEKAKQYYTALGYTSGIAASEVHLGIAAGDLEDLTAARQHFLSALKLYSDLQDERAIAGCFLNLATVSNKSGDSERAIGYCEKAHAIMDRMRVPRDCAMVASTLGLTYDSLGRSEQARACYEQALETAEQQSMQYLVHSLRESLAKLRQREAQREAQRDQRVANA